ncbi:ABC transporter permease [bacterium]|nr:ABC transporter permease [bacterium]
MDNSKNDSRRDPPSRGFAREVAGRFFSRKLACLATLVVIFLTLVAIFAPVIVGTKPVVCRYKGGIYYPSLGYLDREWEHPIFRIDKFRNNYAKNLPKKDPDSWAFWPMVYQDPIRRVRADEKEGVPDSETLQPPSIHHLFGTDPAGVDVFAKMVHGTRTALLVGFVSMGIAALLGIVLGAVAGYAGGWIDHFINRVIEVVLCVPTLILILALIAIVPKPTIWHMMAVIGLTRWTDIARLTRGEFLRLRQSDFVQAAVALGISRAAIIFRHILPNALAPVLVPITFGMAGAVQIEAGLSFLGFGTPPPHPSWGEILDDGRANLTCWWLVTFPGLAIFATVLAYNIIGEALQEATDPRLRDARR